MNLNAPNDDVQPHVLYFMGAKPKLEDGTFWSDMRCVCINRPNLRAIVRNGQIIDAGCPLCKTQVPCEVTNVAGRVEIGFFAPGTVIIS